MPDFTDSSSNSEVGSVVPSLPAIRSKGSKALRNLPKDTVNAQSLHAVKQKLRIGGLRQRDYLIEFNLQAHGVFFNIGIVG